jgi:Cu2+-containing amine oxidase
MIKTFYIGGYYLTIGNEEPVTKGPDYFCYWDTIENKGCFWGAPVNQCGTIDEVISNLKLNIEINSTIYTDDNSKKRLLEQNENLKAMIHYLTIFKTKNKKSYSFDGVSIQKKKGLISIEITTTNGLVLHDCGYNLPTTKKEAVSYIEKSYSCILSRERKKYYPVKN